MSERDHDDERGYGPDDGGHDHDYAVVARPYIQVRVRADTAERGLDALSVTLDYDRSGISTPGEGANTPAGSGRDIEPRELELALYRDGRRILDSEGIDLDTSEVLGYVDSVAMALGRLSRRLR